MAEAELNPYETPKAQDPTETPDGMWQVSGNTQLFQEGARLAEVDVFTGRADVALTPASSEFTAAKSPLVFWLQCGGVLATAAVAFCVRMWDYPVWILAVGPIVLFRILGCFLKSRVVRARLHWLVSPQENARNR